MLTHNSFNTYIVSIFTDLKKAHKNLDKYPEKLKILEYSKAPYYEFLILKYYGFGVINDYGLVFCLRDNWLNIAPREPDKDFKEVLRNRFFSI